VLHFRSTNSSHTQCAEDLLVAITTGTKQTSDPVPLPKKGGEIL